MSSPERRRARAFAAFASGLLFGLGLAVSGMTDPRKVLAFLDVAGRWDPSLLLVMASAVAVTFAATRLVLRRGAPLLDARFHLPTRDDIDPPLLAGAVIFGIGWGLAGYCPGPALASLAAASTDAIAFVAAMAVGMLAYRAMRREPQGREDFRGR